MVKIAVQKQDDCYLPFDEEALEVTKSLADNDKFYVDVIGSKEPEAVIEKNEAGRLKGRADNPTQAGAILTMWPHGYPVKVTIEAAWATLDYKAVFWIWMQAFAKSFTERGRKTTSKEMHDLMCHQFLGYTEERHIGKTVIKPALRTITYPEELTRPAFYDFMRNIEMWASGVGVPVPVYDSQYEQDKRKEDG
jgi:hypothetical protein